MPHPKRTAPPDLPSRLMWIPANGSSVVRTAHLLANYGHWTDESVELTSCLTPRPDPDKMTCLQGATMSSLSWAGPQGPAPLSDR